MRLGVNVIAAYAMLFLSTVSAVAQPAGSTAKDDPANLTIDDAQRILRSGDHTRSPDAMEFLERAAENGDGNALLLLGDAFASGSVVPVDGEKAIEFYRKAAAAGVKFAALKLADVYREGTLTAANPEEAANLYRELADDGVPMAKVRLGEAYVEGRGVPQDIPRGLTLIDEAADLGEQAAMNTLGNLYSRPDSVDDDYAKALSYYERSASAGNIGAMTRLGEIYATGSIAPADSKKAIEYLSRASQAGSNQAGVILAKAHLDRNLGRDSDPGTGLALLRDLSEKGVSQATSTLADAYYRGNGTSRSPEQALSLLDTAAKAGDELAARRLIHYLRDAPGKGAKKNLTRARAIYDQAAEKMSPSIALREELLLDAAEARNIDDFAEVVELFSKLPEDERPIVISALRFTNPNAFVYVAQHRLREKGLYGGALNGRLTASTIRSLNQLCPDGCRRGPLAPSSVRILSTALAE